MWRACYNYSKVIIGMFASSILLATVIWMFHHSQPEHSRASITSPNILGLIWISAHSIGLQDFMKTCNSLPDQLRLKGMKAEVCLGDMKSEPIRLLGSIDHNLQMESKAHPSISEGSSQSIPVWNQLMNQYKFVFSCRTFLHALVMLWPSCPPPCIACCFDSPSHMASRTPCDNDIW